MVRFIPHYLFWEGIILGISETHNIIKETGASEIVVTKSRFIGYLAPVSDAEEAESIIASLRKKYNDARHNCWAYIIMDDNGIFKKCSDDGEPSGTAGRPMLAVLEGASLVNAVCVVTRYFGGVLLGTGGLVRAYTQAVKNALENAESGVMREGCRVVMSFPYQDIDTVRKYVESEGVTKEQEDYLENVRYTCIFPEEIYEKGVSDLIDRTGGRIEISEPEKCSFLDKDKG